VRHMPIASTFHPNRVLFLGVATGEIDLDLRDDRALLCLALVNPLHRNTMNWPAS
jgi:hypothetical protein